MALDLAALRAELAEARDERAQLLHTASQLENQLAVTVVAHQGATTSAPGPTRSRPLRKLSWGASAPGNRKPREGGCPNTAAGVGISSSGKAPAAAPSPCRPQTASAGQSALISDDAWRNDQGGGEGAAPTVPLQDGKAAGGADVGAAQQQPGHISQPQGPYGLPGSCTSVTTGSHAPAQHCYAAAEEAARRSVLRDVLSLMLNIQGPLLDSYRLDAQSVATLAAQQAKDAADLARASAQASAARSAKEAADRAALEAKERAAKEVAEAHALAECERRDLLSQLERARREAGAAARERRDALAKAGQQKREGQEAADALQALKDRASELERQLAAQKRAAAAADKQRGEAERRAHEAEAALAGAHQELGAAQAAAAAAKKSHDKALSHQVQSVAQSLAVKAPATCTAAVGEAAASVQGALSGLAELEAEWAAAQSGVDGLLQGLSAEVADMRAAIAELRPQLASEMADVQGALSSTLANVQASYQVASQGLAAKTEQLLSLDAQLSSLGPEGLDGMCRELHQARAKLAQTEADKARQAQELVSTEAARRQLVTERQIQAAELQMLTAAQSDLVRELAAVRAAGERSSKHAEALKTQLEAERASARALAKQLQEVQTELAASQQQLAEARQQVALVEAGRREAESQVQVVKQQALSEVQAVHTQAAALVQALRLRFFQPPGSAGAVSLSGTASEGTQPGAASQSNAPGEGEGRLSALVSGPVCGPPGQVDSPAAGPSPCQLSHDQLMDRFETYLQRQAQVRAQVHHHQQQQGPEALSKANSIGDGSSSGQPQLPQGMRALELELLWLEGCLLVSLVEMRASQRTAQQLQEELQEAVGNQQHVGAGSGAAAASQSCHAAGRWARQSADATSGLVSQMVRAMAQEKRVLQRRVSVLEGQCSAQAPPGGVIHPFTAYLPVRRSLSARASLLSPTPVPSLSRPPSAPLTAAPLRPFSAAQESSNPSPHPLAQGPRQTSQQPPGSSGSSSILQDTPQVVLLPAGPSVRECGPAASPATATQQAWDEGEVDELLQVLEASELRRSRGLAGLMRLQQQQLGQASSPAAGSRKHPAAAAVLAAHILTNTHSPAKAEGSKHVGGEGRMSPSVGLGAFRAGGVVPGILSRGPCAGSVRGSPHAPRRQ